MVCDSINPTWISDIYTVCWDGARPRELCGLHTVSRAEWREQNYIKKEVSIKFEVGSKCTIQVTLSNKL